MKDERLEANWEDHPDEWEPVSGWEVVGEGDITGETQWRKGSFSVEVVYACLVSRSDVYFAARDRASLEEWKRDHGIKGQISADHEVVHRG